MNLGHPQYFRQGHSYAHHPRLSPPGLHSASRMVQRKFHELPTIWRWPGHRMIARWMFDRCREYSCRVQDIYISLYHIKSLYQTSLNGTTLQLRTLNGDFTISPKSWMFQQEKVEIVTSRYFTNICYGSGPRRWIDPADQCHSHCGIACL